MNRRPKEPEIPISLWLLASTAARLLSRPITPIIRRKPGRKPGFKPPTKDQSARTTEILRMAREGCTLSKIGNKFFLTRERVRQILDKEGVNINDYRGVKPQKYPITAFKKRMNRWLNEVGYAHCSGCKLYLCEDAHFVLSQPYMCRKCNSKRSRERYNNDPIWRDYIKAYRQTPAQRERIAEYSKRWHAEHPEAKERMLTKRKERYRTDPEYRAKFLSYDRRSRKEPK